MPNPRIKHTTAFRRFKKDAESWLTPEDTPSVVLLESLAEELDKEMKPGLVNAYAVGLRALMARKPVGSNDEDELTKALREAGEES